MRVLPVICILLFTHPTLGHAQTGAPPRAPAGAGVVEGDVYLRMAGGEIRKMAAGRVYLVPDSVTRSLAPLCVARDSSRKLYLRLRRPVRLAYDSARTARGRARESFLARADSARAAAFAALEPGRRAENEIVERVAAQREAPTGMAAHYTFEGVAPGRYALYSDTDLLYFWFVPVRVEAGRVTRDLDNNNVSRVVVDKAYTIAADVCSHAIDVPRPAVREGAEERRPVLANRDAIRAALERRYPRALRGVGGQVTVRLRVLEDGSVDIETIEAIDSALPKEVRGEAEAAAEMIAEEMRFDPAAIDGRPVKVWVMVPIVFL